MPLAHTAFHDTTHRDRDERLIAAGTLIHHDRQNQRHHAASGFAALALCLTGFISAKLGGADWKKAVLRNAGMGLGTMVFSWLVGLVFNVTTGA